MAKNPLSSSLAHCGEENGRKEGKLNDVLKKAPSVILRDQVRPRLIEHARRLSYEEYLELTTEDERNVLRFELNCAVLHFLDRGLPVYLEKLGILYPVSCTTSKTHLFSDSYMLREETVQDVRFEKCDDPIGLSGETVSRLCQTWALNERIYPRLPLQLQFKWSQAEVRSFIKAFFCGLRQRIVRNGHSSLLSAVGDFYALHNRQGSTPDEWYAGADIFVKARRHLPITVGKQSVYRRPVVKDSWEILQAAFGAPLGVFGLDTASVLKELGYDLQTGVAPGLNFREKIDVAVFLADGGSTLIYATNGLRACGLQQEPSGRTGSEIVFQCSPKESGFKEGRQFRALPALAAEAIVMGWILMLGSKSRTLKPGVGLACPGNLGGTYSRLSAVLVTNFSKVPYEQLSSEGPFFYANVLGITADEAELIKRRQRNHLLAALEERGQDQLTNSRRSSVLIRTNIEPAANIKLPA